MGDLTETLVAYFKECPHPVVLAYLFGSHAKGSATPLSDVDVAVLLDEADREKRQALYLDLLGDLTKLARPSDVDLLMLGDATEPLGCRAILEGLPLYSADERRRVRTEEQAIAEVLDGKELHVIRERYLRRRVLEGRMGQGGNDMIDRRTVQERLDFIDGMLAHLKGYRSLTLEEFARDLKTCHAALYELRTTWESVADIGNHLIAALGLRRPGDRGEISGILAEGGVIPIELADRLHRAMGMRNVLVHGYLRIAIELVHAAIRNDLGDIEEFCRCILTYLETHDWFRSAVLPPAPAP